MEVSVHVATAHHTSSLITNGPTVHWVGPETLVGLQVEGREVDALADNGSQVNTVTPVYVCQHEFPVLSLHYLVDHPLNLVGLGGMRTHLLGFVILRVCGSMRSPVTMRMWPSCRVQMNRSFPSMSLL